MCFGFSKELSQCTHNICFSCEIRKLFSNYAFLSRGDDININTVCDLISSLNEDPDQLASNEYNFGQIFQIMTFSLSQKIVFIFNKQQVFHFTTFPQPF